MELHASPEAELTTGQPGGLESYFSKGTEVALGLPVHVSLGSVCTHKDTRRCWCSENVFSPLPLSLAQVCFSWHWRVNRCEQVYRPGMPGLALRMAFTHQRWQLPPSAGCPSKHIVAWHLHRLQPTCERAPCHPSRWAEAVRSGQGSPSWRCRKWRW